MDVTSIHRDITNCLSSVIHVKKDVNIQRNFRIIRKHTQIKEKFLAYGEAVLTGLSVRKLCGSIYKKHSPDAWTCKKCNPEKTFDTYSYYTQHDKGVHGKGFKTRCGEIKRWPHQRSKHQKDCTKCRALKDERLNLPDNPRPYKCRNLAKLQEVAT